MYKFPIVFALALAACSAKAPLLIRHAAPEAVAGQAVVIRDVRVFTGAGTAAVEHQDVVLRGGSIASVEPTGIGALPESAQLIDGKGLTLLPGLIDIHTHPWGAAEPPWAMGLPQPERNLEAYLFAGITTIVDLGGPLGRSVDLREDLANGEIAGPRMLIAGPHLTIADGHPIAMVQTFVPWPLNVFLEGSLGTAVGAPDEAAEAMASYLEARVDVIKLTSDEIPLGVPTLDAATAKAIIDHAHANGLRAYAHIGTNEDAQKMLAGGIDVLVHGIYREPVSDTIIRMLVDQGVPVAPTMKVWDTSDRLSTGELTLSPLQRQIGGEEAIRVIFDRPEGYEIPDAFNRWLRSLRDTRDIRRENVKRMHEAGVVILAGSDSPSIGQFAGATLHDELDLLVDAGLTPAEALLAATSRNAAVLGIADEVGEIAPGKRADLLLVRGDPTADIAAVHEIEAVYQAGRRVDRRP